MEKYITGALLIDGTGREPVSRPVIVIQDGCIVRIGTQKDIVIPEGKEVINCGTGVILPGLVDAHSHAGEDSAREESIQQQHLQPEAVKALRGSISLKKDLMSGVTTIRLLGDGVGRVDKYLRDAIAQEEIEGPRVLAACLAIRPSHGTAPEIGISADGVDEVRKAVRKAIFWGADVIKLFITNICQGETYIDYLNGDLTGIAAYTKPEIEAAAEEAHRAGLKLACHCIGGAAVKWALEAGADSLEHCNLISDNDIELFLKYDAILSDPNLHLFFDKRQGFESDGNKTHKWDELPEWWHEKVRAARENTRQVMHRALRSGVKFALGTDLNHGNLWLECKYFVSEIGASPMEAIIAVTRNGALACGMDKKIGTIETGKLADIICTRENPLENIENLKDITFVIKEGRLAK